MMPRVTQEESYRELLERMKTAKPGRECRELHRKLRKYGRGLFFTDRYPNFSIWLSAIAAVISLLAFILKLFGTWN